MKDLSPREQEVYDEYLKLGSQKEVGEALGISRSTVKTILNRVNNKFADRHQESAEVKKLRTQLQLAKRRQAGAEATAKELHQQLQDRDASQFTIPKQKIRKAQGKKPRYNVAFGDTHGASLDPNAWQAFLKDVEVLRPHTVIHGGDVLDCGGWLASHHTTHYIAQTDYSYQDEVVAGNMMFDQLQEVCPDSHIHVIEGNHDRRVETWALTTTQKHRLDSEFLLEALGPRSVLNLDKRGIEWYERHKVHKGSVAGGTLKLGKVYFSHPEKASKHHAAKMATEFGKNVVYFHTHRRDYFTASNIVGEEWAAWCPGCMCVKRKYWHHTENFKHTQGYWLQIEQTDGSFLGINVPIINGVSYLSSMLYE